MIISSTSIEILRVIFWFFLSWSCSIIINVWIIVFIVASTMAFDLFIVCVIICTVRCLTIRIIISFKHSSFLWFCRTGSIFKIVVSSFFRAFHFLFWISIIISSRIIGLYIIVLLFKRITRLLFIDHIRVKFKSTSITFCLVISIFCRNSWSRAKWTLVKLSRTSRIQLREIGFILLLKISRWSLLIKQIIILVIWINTTLSLFCIQIWIYFSMGVHYIVSSWCIWKLVIALNFWKWKLLLNTTLYLLLSWFKMLLVLILCFLLILFVQVWLIIWNLICLMSNSSLLRCTSRILWRIRIIVVLWSIVLVGIIVVPLVIVVVILVVRRHY